MKLRHLLVAGLLTTVAAVMLLTLVFPQSAEAAKAAYVCNYLTAPDTCPILSAGQMFTRQEALAYCDAHAGLSRCYNPSNNHTVCGSDLTCHY